MMASEGGGQDFDLNLAPIIDCLTVLITFMLASASFLALGFIDTGAAINGPSDNKNQPPPAISLEVGLAPSKDLRVKVTGRVQMDKKIAAKDGQWDVPALLEEIKKLQQKWPDTKSVVLNAGDDVEYAEIVLMMEKLRRQLPSILLGGFS